MFFMAQDWKKKNTTWILFAFVEDWTMKIFLGFLVSFHLRKTENENIFWIAGLLAPLLGKTKATRLRVLFRMCVCVFEICARPSNKKALTSRMLRAWLHSAHARMSAKRLNSHTSQSDASKVNNTFTHAVKRCTRKNWHNRFAEHRCEIVTLLPSGDVHTTNIHESSKAVFISLHHYNALRRNRKIKRS